MHFELSPMYNAILIKEMMLCYDLQINNNGFENVLSHMFKDTIERAMSFYDFISVDEYYPCFNDSYFLPGLKKTIIKENFKTLGLKSQPFKQSKSSGYRKYSIENFTLIFDAAQIGPRYQPGHAHADNLTFNLYYKFKPVIVDTGTSVYEDTPRRFLERSTESHNTIKYRNQNSSEVWSSF